MSDLDPMALAADAMTLAATLNPQPAVSLIRRGPGREKQAGSTDTWDGRRAQAFTRLTLATYGTTCWLCGLPGARTADHVVPISRGGAVFDLDNLAPAHGSCNFRRGNRPAEVYDRVESGIAFFSVA